MPQEPHLCHRGAQNHYLSRGQRESGGRYSGPMTDMAACEGLRRSGSGYRRPASPAFAEWAQRPMQEEMFGHNRAGEVFFDHLRGLLGRQDSDETADCPEVYTLCMLLGFRGRHAISFGGMRYASLPSVANWPGSAGALSSVPAALGAGACSKASLC